MLVTSVLATPNPPWASVESFEGPCLRKGVLHPGHCHHVGDVGISNPQPALGQCGELLGSVPAEGCAVGG
ncbi:hypothetical protein EVAR_41402_1 [Eumeta japonica]|uniref:Uncharacterized protein n=1 Tax=Eumeta variegata TaxID=151549 RepID=A0A4C1X1M8_EUMVA|nr:hypothetical protein EVAR_41402_1 [Eumeta japonica]